MGLVKSRTELLPLMMPRAYIVYFKYKIPSEKAQGPVRQFRIYATSLEEARRLLTQYANYPNLEVIDVKAA